MSSELHFLRGLLAVQCGFASKETLLAAMRAWHDDKSRQLETILDSNLGLTRQQQTLLAALLEEHLKQHGNDPQKSLAALSVTSSLLEGLAHLIDPQGDHTSAHPSKQEEPGPVMTMPIDASRAESASPRGPGLAGDSPKNRFTLVRTHAKGGLGQVSVALDRELNRYVALKEILPQRADDRDSQERFVLEAEITGQLEHPGIVPVYGLGTYGDGRPYYAMRFVEGDNLKSAIAAFHHQRSGNETLTGARAIAFRGLLGRFVDVCNAIEYAHSRKVLHRDLKPENILLGPYGETLVVDWGLAKPVGAKERERKAQPDDHSLHRPVQVRSGSSETLDGSAIGTPSYMSPEQAEGNIQDLGPATDIYSLGATLYALLTGMPPVKGETLLKTLEKVRKGEIEPPRRHWPAIPKSLEAVCLKSLSLQAGDRYPSAKALADDIEKWLADEPVSAYAEPWPAQAKRWIKRHPAMVSTASACLVLGMAAAIFVAYLNGVHAKTLEGKNTTISQQNSELEKRNGELVIAKDAAQNAQKETLKEKQETERLLVKSEGLLYASNLSLAQLSFADRNAVQANRYLDATQKELRGWEHDYLRSCFNSRLTILANQTGINFAVNDVSYSPDGSRIASCIADNTIRIWDAATGKELSVWRSEKVSSNKLAFSADGKFIVSGHDDNTVALWDLEKQQISQLFQGHSEPILCVAISPDGLRIASGSGFPKSEVKIWDRASGKALHTLPTEGNPSTVAFSPDSKRLACSKWGTPQGVTLWDVESGSSELNMMGHNGEAASVAFSSDGQKIASSGGDNTIKIWDAKSGAEIKTLTGGEGMISDISFSPDGKSIAGCGGPRWNNRADGDIKIWDVETGDVLSSLTGHTARVVSVCFHPNGKQILSGAEDGALKVWDANFGTSPPVLIRHQALVNRIRMSPNGKYLASAGMDSVAKVWDVELGREVLSLTHSVDKFADVGDLCFTTDSKSLLTVEQIHQQPSNLLQWDLQSGTSNALLKGQAGAITRIDLTQDGSRFLTASGDKNFPDQSGEIKIWKLGANEELLSIKGHQGGIACACFSPDDELIASGGYDGKVKLWDAKSGRELQTFTGHLTGVLDLAFSPDGKRLASAGGFPSDKKIPEEIKLWDLARGVELFTLKGHTSSVYCVAFAADGKRLASGGLDKSIKIWNVENGMEVLTLKDQEEPVSSLLFSQDGKRLYSASWDKTVRVREARR